MTAYYIVLLLLFLALVAVLFVRYVNLTVDKEFRNLAKASTDDEYRKLELARLDKELTLQDSLLGPTPGALRGPAKGAGRLLAPALLAVGIILLWGGVFAKPSEKPRWFWSGGIACVGSAAAMLASLRKRRLERYARILRARADLRRLDENHQGTSDDLERLLKLTPWDDAAWAEFGDAQKEVGKSSAALEAYKKAYMLDPGYADYYIDVIGLAIEEGLSREADLALEEWDKNIQDPRPSSEARMTAYKSALLLAKGRDAESRDMFTKAARLDKEALLSAIDFDPVLEKLRSFEKGVS